MASGGEAVAVAAHLLEMISPDTEGLVTPRGYAHLGLAVVDAVYSLNLRYGIVETVVDAHCQGVPALRDPTGRFLDAAPVTEYTAADLLARCGDLRGMALTQACFGGNENKTPGARTWKADAVRAEAAALVGAGVVARHDLLGALEDAERLNEIRRAWVSVGGVADTGWRYLLSLSGADWIKPDRMIIRFIGQAYRAAGLTAPLPSPAEAAEVLKEAGRQAYGGVSLRALDHSVWLYQSGRR